MRAKGDHFNLEVGGTYI